MAQQGTQFDKELFFAALADRTRLRLLNLMGDAEVCVCYFVEILGAPQPKVSRHLAYLRRAGVVAARREVTWVHYRIIKPKDPDAAKVLGDVLAWVANDPEMQADRRKLARVCCAPEVPVQLQGAPRPTSLTGR
jgi:ArsR family transcriptional regulator